MLHSVENPIKVVKLFVLHKSMRQQFKKRYSIIVNLYLYTNHCSDEQPKSYFDIASALFNNYLWVTT